MEATTATEALPQHMQALARANEIRCGAAEAKRELARGEITIQEALRDPRLQPERLGRLLAAQSRWGVTRARKLCGRLNAGATVEFKRVNELTPRQKGRLLSLLEDPSLDYRVIDPLGRYRR